MRRLLFMPVLSGPYHVQYAGDRSPDEIAVCFTGGWTIQQRDTIVFREGLLERSNISWLWNRGRTWCIDFDRLKAQVDLFQDLDWLTGVSPVQPEFRDHPGPLTGGNGPPVPSRRVLEFRVYRGEFVVDRNRQVFLSHKTADKPMVREYFRILKTLGFDPWLDEDAMAAGASLERAILDGFERSCAAVFFVTPNYQDANFLATEVDYAIAQKRRKGDRFAIVAMVLGDRKQKGRVPSLLEKYVWKEPQSQLEALDEIIKALPLAPGEPFWRPHLSPG